VVLTSVTRSNLVQSERVERRRIEAMMSGGRSLKELM